MEILPTGLPDLSKPSRDLLELRKTEFFRNMFLNKNVNEYSISSVLPFERRVRIFHIFYCFPIVDAVHREGCKESIGRPGGRVCAKVGF